MIVIIRRAISVVANKSGATAIEYAIIAGCIALVIVGAVGEIGTRTNDSFEAADAGFN